MKRRILTVIAFSLIVLLCSCGTKISYKQEKRLEATGNTSWTVLIYACGDNGSKASNTIRELTQYKYPENVNVVMQTGGGENWELKEIDGSFIQRYEMQYGSAFLKDQKQGASMGTYSVFADFINWGIQEYKTDKYILVLMGDGNGMEVLSDELYGGDTLNIEEMYYALSKVNGVLDAICFDGAYMASLEMATALSTYAKYMVASEEKCSGFDYCELVDCLITYPNAGIEEMCNEMCNAYLRKSEEEGSQPMAQLSSIDLSQISNLNLAFDGMAHEILTHSNDLTALGGVTRMMEEAQRCAGSEMVDILSLANALSSVAGETPQTVREALLMAVKNNVKGQMREQSSGISVYYPTKSEEWTLNEYMKHSHSDNYKSFLKNTITDTKIVDEYISTDFSDTVAWEEYGEKNMMCSSQIEGEKAVVNIAPDMQTVKNVKLNRYFYSNESKSYLECGNTMELECLWDDCTYKSELKRKIPVVKGVALDCDIASRNGGYTIYSVNTVFKERLAQMYVAYNVTEENYEYLGLWDNGTFVKNSSNEEVTLLNTDRETQKKLPTKTVKEKNIKVKGKVPPRGKYIYEFEVEDIYRKKYICNPIEFEVGF